MDFKPTIAQLKLIYLAKEFWFTIMSTIEKNSRYNFAMVWNFEPITWNANMFSLLDPGDSMPEGFVPTSYIEIYDKFAQPQPV